jgi:hypothetical protein
VRLATHPLHTPQYLSAKIFSNKSKKIISDVFAEYKILYKDRILSTTNGVKNYNDFCAELTRYIDFINSEDLSALIPAFFKFSDKLDEIRNQQFSKISPLTYNLLNLQ